MEIRHAKEKDLDTIMEIYAYARRFMAENGNPLQWGATNWPPEELIRKDIESSAFYLNQQTDRQRRQILTCRRSRRLYFQM